LGISMVPAAVAHYWYLAFVPIIYIAAITTISRGEVHGGSRRVLYFAAFLYVLVIAAVLTVSILNNHLFYALPFLALFAFLIYAPLQKAIQSPVGPRIGKAVKAGVIALIAMNAAWAAAFGAVVVALLIILLLPLSVFIARQFAVT
ncbi:MAG: polyprenyltransferase, partial [Chitinophagaceae bacterium]